MKPLTLMHHFTVQPHCLLSRQIVRGLLVSEKFPCQYEDGNRVITDHEQRSSYLSLKYYTMYMPCWFDCQFARAPKVWKSRIVLHFCRSFNFANFQPFMKIFLRSKILCVAWACIKFVKFIFQQILLKLLLDPRKFSTRPIQYCHSSFLMSLFHVFRITMLRVSCLMLVWGKNRSEKGLKSNKNTSDLSH